MKCLGLSLLVRDIGEEKTECLRSAIAFCSGVYQTIYTINSICCTVVEYFGKITNIHVSVTR